MGARVRGGLTGSLNLGSLQRVGGGEGTPQHTATVPKNRGGWDHRGYPPWVPEDTLCFLNTVQDQPKDMGPGLASLCLVLQRT